MPDGPYATPDEQALMRMINQAGSPQAAGQSLVERLEALEAAVAELERSCVEQAADEASEAAEL